MRQRLRGGRFCRGIARCLSPAAYCFLIAASWPGPSWNGSAFFTTDPDDRLAQFIDQLLARPQLAGASVGVQVVRLSDGKTLYARQADRLFIPASNVKILTTAAALHVLGPEYEFRTGIGLADSDLVVVGGGDPAIGGRFADDDPTAYLRRWASELKGQGITHVAGDLVVDDSFFDRQFVHPNWSNRELGHWYAAPIAALAVNDNCVDVRIAPGPKPGVPASVSLIPVTRLFQIDNRTRTVATSKEHAPRVARQPGGNVIRCEGGVYARARPVTSWVTVDDPPMLFGAVFRDVLTEQGVEVAGGVRRELGIGRSTGFRPRVVHRFPLLPVLAVANKESQNLYAEQLLKTLGAEQGDGSWNGGRRVAVAALGELGVDPSGYVLDDGCGLSRANRVSPRAVVALLCAVHHGAHGELFRQTLPVSGVDGTLRKRLTGQPYRGRVFAKTGSITGVRAISGYAETRSGEWLAFSLLINDARSSVRDVQDDFCKLLVDYDERSGAENRGVSLRSR